MQITECINNVPIRINEETYWSKSMFTGEKEKNENCYTSVRLKKLLFWSVLILSLILPQYCPVWVVHCQADKVDPLLPWLPARKGFQVNVKGGWPSYAAP